MLMECWSNLRLRTKGLFSVVLPAAATVMIAYASYVIGNRAADEDRLVRRSYLIREEVARLRAMAAEISGEVRGYFITNDEQFARNAQAITARFDGSRQKLSSLLSGSEGQRDLLVQLEPAERSWAERNFMNISRFRSGALPRGEVRPLMQASEQERRRIESILEKIGQEESRLLELRLERLETLRGRLRATTGFFVLLGVLGGLGVSFLFASGITNRIVRLQEGIGRLAEGGVLDPLPGGLDEIGALSDGVAAAAHMLEERNAALENAFHGIAQVDESGRYLSFNRAYAAMTGFHAGMKPDSILSGIHPDDREEFGAALCRMRSEGRAEMDARLSLDNGGTADVGITLLPVSKDSRVGYWVFLRDNTGHKKAEAELVRAKDTAVASNLAKTAFLAKISHDIRTPLNAVLGTADLLSQTCLTADQAEYVNIFQRNCQRLVALINDFLDFSKIEAGAVRIEKVPYEIRETVNHAVATYRESAFRKGIELAVRIDPALPAWGMGDPLRIQQVLVNLLSNALKFTQEGLVCVEVRRDSGPCGGQLQFQVSDTGAGIRPEDQEQIFGAFTQLANQGSPAVPGCGLGLTICRELVELMGGEIVVSSQYGRGSTFSFSLPLEEAQPAEAVAEQARAKPQWSWCSEPVRVLIAEDTEDNRLLMTHYLRGEPFDLQFAADGQEALDAIRGGEQFDLILMDIDMPGLDGYSATRQIREWQKSSGELMTPVVGLSAHAMREAVRASLDAGCVTHVAKPVDRSTLLQTIRRYARPRRERRRHPVAVTAEVAALVPKYLGSKPRQIEEARTWLAAGEFDLIRRFGHSLRGTGSGYGFPRIEELGREIERSAMVRDEPNIAKQLDSLLEFINHHAQMRVGSGDPEFSAILEHAS